jgi:hypothetical protein
MVIKHNVPHVVYHLIGKTDSHSNFIYTWVLTLYMYMYSETPIRSRLLEKTVAGLLVGCENTGCHLQINFCDRVRHQTNECGHRFVNCKFHPLGCNWRDIELKRKPHEKSYVTSQKPLRLHSCRFMCRCVIFCVVKVCNSSSRLQDLIKECRGSKYRAQG